MNISGARRILQSLFDLGVREVCVCAGSRNSPFVMVLEQARNIRQFSFFEERSAGFFALGRIKQHGQPVAVITTSGTAAAELLPATIEAHYSALPLILVTADRPPHYRGTGSPQTIEQVGLFSHYVSATYDLTTPAQEFSIQLGKRPLHINVCFDEPLLDGPIEAFDFHKPTEVFNSSFAASEPLHCAMKRPLVIVGKLSAQQRPAVERALASLRAPIYAEATSGLRSSSLLSSYLLRSGDSIFSTPEARAADGVIRIGSIPTVRFWRDLEKLSWPVLSLSEEPFAGMTEGKLHHTSHFASALAGLEEMSVQSNFCDRLLQRDQSQTQRLQQLLQDEPLSEAGWFYWFSKTIPARDSIYLGNSLPIREWDLAATFHKKHDRIEVNRGANGIDGQVSTFFGAALPNIDNWGFFGDLTTLYDLSAPWILPQLGEIKTRTVVINNQGGQIFSRLFASPRFINSHHLQFEKWAGLWNLHFSCWSEPPSDLPIADHAVIEVRPDASSSQRFWQAYGDMWKSR